MPIHDREIRASDGTRIAYGVSGEGPTLVLTNGLTTTTTFWRYLEPSWRDRFRVITWDLPGHGASDPARSRGTASIEGQPEIIARIMEATSVDRAVHIGFSMGCQIVLEMARQFPSRCEGVVTLLGPSAMVLSATALPIPGKVLSLLMRHTPTRVFGPALRAVTFAAHSPIGHFVGRSLDIAGPACSAEDLKSVTGHMCSMDPETVRLMAISAEEHTAQDFLPIMRAPLLIVAGDKDRFAPADEVGVRMHALAPDSELLRLEDATHTALLDDPEPIRLAIESFIERRLTYAAFASANA